MPSLDPAHHPAPGASTSTMETLLRTTAVATTRANEATLMSGGVASAIDEATRGADSWALPSHLRGV
ncbi:hypothetical protein K3495_g1953 [Podosphaera aphanis]|nr:hypothetical protein K3495_g1953 [Podosphaera aphanis]